MAKLQNAECEPALKSVVEHLLLLLSFFGIVSIGCDRSDQLLEIQQAENGQSLHLVHTTASPKNILSSSISRYQSLQAYQDQAFVKLAYLSNGQPTEDRAPMSIAWDAKGNIGLRVYSVIAGPNQAGRWRLSLGKGYAELASQLLSRKLPEQVDLPWLLSEPLVSESLSAGLGGFPPQLDLLLSPQPLSRLADDAAAYSLLEPQSINGQPCSIVSLTRNGLTYVFWIDQETNLLRRLELPTQLLPQDILTDQAITQVQLSIEFAETKVNQAINWSQYQPTVDATTQLVQRFVASPPKLETRMLGERIPAFRLLSPTGNVAFDSTAKPERKASVLMWLADHPACLAAAEQLQATQQQLLQAGIKEGEVEFVPIWAESQPPSGLTFEQLQHQWKLPGRLALDRSAAGRDLFHVQEAPTVAILDGHGKLQFIDVRLNPVLDRALAPLVSRVVEGVDVAAELKQAQTFTEVRYRAQLALAAATDASENQRQGQESYPPESLQLAKSGNKNLPARIIALAQDARQTIWALQSDGTLQGLDATLKPLYSFATQWIDLTNSSTRLLPAPDGKLFALSTPGAVDIFDGKSQQSIRYALPDNANVVDMQWLAMASSKELRLAAITTGKQVMLFDPQNHQQLSGNCPSKPLAILTQRNRGDLDGLVVLSNRSLEPLKLTAETGAVSANPVNHSLPEPSRQLSINPSHGPWETSRDSKSEQTLATGWIAEEELSLFFLDEQLRPFWHYRLPAENSLTSKHQMASAVSPGNGSIVWAVLDTSYTIHVLRGDVMWSDHFRHAGRVSGIALVPSGDRLVLLVASQSTITAYELQ